MVAIYAIAKNEAEHVPKFMEHAHEADHVVVIVSDESTDGTADLLRQHGATVHVRPDPRPWRWDVARNTALSLVPEDVDCCVSMDLDESLDPGWRKELDKAWGTGARWISYRYICPTRGPGGGHHAAIGTTNVDCYRSKAHARHGFHWEQPVHEKLVPDFPVEHTTCEMTVRHHRQHHVDYIPQLTAWLEEEPDNADAYIQRGADYLSIGEYDKAETDYLKMLSLTHDMTDDHTRAKRAWGWLAIANARHRRGDERGAVLDALLSAVAAHPGLRDPWVYLAEGMMSVGNMPLAYGAAMTAMGITDPRGHARDERCWGDLPKQIASAAFSHLMNRGGYNG